MKPLWVPENLLPIQTFLDHSFKLESFFHSPLRSRTASVAMRIGLSTLRYLPKASSTHRQSVEVELVKCLMKVNRNFSPRMRISHSLAANYGLVSGDLITFFSFQPSSLSSVTVVESHTSSKVQVLALHTLSPWFLRDFPVKMAETVMQFTAQNVLAGAGFEKR